MLFNDSSEFLIELIALLNDIIHKILKTIQLKKSKIIFTPMHIPHHNNGLVNLYEVFELVLVFLS